MIYLSIEKENKELSLFINSPGGWVIPGIAIYDTMQFVQPDVQTVCLGLAASMGSFLLAGGTITKRLAFPHAWRQWFFFLRISRIDIYLYILYLRHKNQSNNSMVFWIPYAIFLNHLIIYRKSSMKKRVFQILSDL